MDAINAAAELTWLRSQFPTCGIIRDPFADRWLAVPHTGGLLEDRTPDGLRRQLWDRNPDAFEGTWMLTGGSPSLSRPSPEERMARIVL